MTSNRYSHMVQEYYVGRVREVLRARRGRLANLKTRADAQAYVKHIRKAVRKCFAPIPKRTPLKAVITGRDEFAHVVLEKVLFESRPGLYVTGNLYIPKRLQAKCPGILCLCGHAGIGKAEPFYQTFARNLARKGFVSFIYDPIDQGERAQYYPRDGGPALGKDGRAVPSVCSGHNWAGNAMRLLGDFFGTWRVWEAIRALDYLQARPEVDPKRLGVTGNSGGGTLSGYLTALDRRLTMAAPSCFVCSYQANLEEEMPCDTEQNPPGILAAGLDHADLLMCYAPRPTLILGQYYDYFSEQWARRAAEEVKKLYRLLGAEDNIECFIGPHDHGYYRENREAMYGFFLKHARLKAKPGEAKIRSLPAKKLFVTPTGETYRAGSRRVFEFTAETAQSLAKQRGKPSERKVVAAARKLLNFPKVTGAPYFRSLIGCDNYEPRSGGPLHFAVETEPGIQVILTAFGPLKGPVRLPTGNITLYVGHTSGQEDIEKINEVKSLMRGRNAFFVAVDPRGIGQSMAQTVGANNFFDIYGLDFMYAAQCEMLGESYLGRRVYDVLRVIDLFLAEGAKRVDLVGRGMGAVVVAFAAMLHPARPRARILHYLPSYELIARTPISRWPLSSLLRGVLRHFDLPDVYRVLGRRLVKEKPWNTKMRPLGSSRSPDSWRT